jgi:3-oxoadipate enol-lactonase
MPEGPVSVEMIADDAAAVLGALDVASAHVAGFSSGNIIAQKLALAHAELVRSLVLQSTWSVVDPYFTRGSSSFAGWSRSPQANAQSSKGSTWTSIRGGVRRRDRRPFHRGGARLPPQQSTGGMQRFIDAFVDHNTTHRLPEITAPTLVLAGGRDVISRPPLCRAVAERIPGPHWTSWRKRLTSRARRYQTSGTPASIHSGGRSWPELESAPDGAIAPPIAEWPRIGG